MIWLLRIRLAGLFVLMLTLAPLAFVGAQAPAATDETIETHDGASLSGQFYAAGGKKSKEATVILLHNFDLKKGGGSGQEGWADMAKALQEDGYGVLTFDFRGFGRSKSVKKDQFWAYPHNLKIAKGGKHGETIEYNQFNTTYMPYLVNDIAAAKAHLDRLNDRNLCNTSKVILIGAGDGAALGMMWMAAETRRCKGELINMVELTLRDPESKDLMAGVWLSLNDKAGGKLLPVGKFANVVGRQSKIPLLFVFGGNDNTSATVARNLEKVIKPMKTKDFPNTRAVPIKGTKLVGSNLIDKSLIDEIKKYLEEAVPKERRVREERKIESTTFYYVNAKGGVLKKMHPLPIPDPKAKGAKLKLNTVPGVDIDFATKLAP